MTEKTNTPELRFPEFREGWKEFILNDVSIKKSKKNKNNLYNETFTNSAEYGIVSQKEYFDKEISNKKNLNNYYIVEPNDFVYNPRISNLAPVGPINRNKLNRTGVMSPLYTVFSTKLSIKSFLEYYFKTSKWHRFMKLNGDSGARSDRFTIKQSLFIKMPIFLPSNQEQEKIGDFFSKLDQQIELEEKKLELLEQQKRGYMQKIFTQKLRFKDKTGNIYPNWKTTELKDILEKIIDNRGKTPDNAPSEKYPLLEVNALGYYHPSYKKVSKFVSEDTYNNWFREHLKENDILFSTVGNTGIVSLMDNYKAVIAQNIVGLRVNNNNIPSFVYYMLSYWENQKKIKRIQMGAVQPSVKVSQFKFIKYLIPIKDEQEKIANLLSEIDKVINKQLIKIEVLKQRKQGLLQKMFI
ncbi:restriction endonuclease subunit S [Staphylococcus epidermidis]|nr:restriction endonuclease subunit S [Staphylococcus epidermidis]